MATTVEVQEEQTKKEINWDIPQLVINDQGTIIQTNGEHVDNLFSGFVVRSDYYNVFRFDKDWGKQLVTPFYGKIILTNSNK